MIDSKERALIEELKALQEENERLKDAMSFQQITLRKQIRQKNKIYAIYLNLCQQRNKSTRVLNNSIMSDSLSIGQSKLMGSFRSTEPQSVGKQRQKLQKQKQRQKQILKQKEKTKIVKFHQLQIVVDQVETKPIPNKSIGKPVSHKQGYSTLKQLRIMQQNTEQVGNISTPVSTRSQRKKTYFEKLAEQNTA